MALELQSQRSRIPSVVAVSVLLIAVAPVWWAMSSLMAMPMMDATAFLVTWLLMVAGMMLPTVALMVGATWVFLSRRTWDARVARMTAFVGSYIVLWALAGGAALACWMLAGAVPVFAAILVALAGAYQLTGLKDRCLRICRTPVGFLMQHGAGLTSVNGSLLVGARHAAVCIGCCAGLMVALTGAGIMDVAWMAALALLMLLEKVHPYGHAFGRLAGVLLLAASPFALRLASGDGLARTAGGAAMVVLVIVAVLTLLPRRLGIWSRA